MGLTPDQIKKIEKANEEYAQKTKALVEKIREFFLNKATPDQQYEMAEYFLGGIEEYGAPDWWPKELNRY